ncbi:patellin-3-like [Quercus lobata]|uniref:Patellin-3 n=1 Tax=Quercus lobata TaxID=97700 RepID=A0A7N2KUX5_QUELO|nr:patellin-3-like [Quercus lobata]
MAEEQHQKPAPEVAASSTVVEEVVEVIPPEKPITENEPAPAPAPEPEPEAPEKPVTFEELVEGEKATSIEEKEKTKPSEEAVNVAQSDSFKEESYVVGELPDLQKKALDELKQLIQDALNKHEFTAPPPPPPPPPKEEEKKEEKKEEKEKSPVAAAEEVKEESKTEEVKEESKTEEVKEEASKLEEEVAEAKKEEEEEKELIALVTPKVEQEASSSITIEAKVEKEEEKVTPPPPTEEVVAVVVEKETSIVDEDGAKTVEEIKETIVEVSAPPPPPTTETEEPKEEVTPPPAPEEVSIWGIPLLQDERSDVILLKFLRARDYKVKDAFTMIKNTVRWRKEFEIDALLEQDHGNDWDKVAFTHGYDKKGHPVCYNAFSEFQNKDLYQNTFSTDEKRQKFLKWRIQFLEKSIRKLDFSPTGISSFVQVNDFKNSFGIGKRELWQATKLAVQLLQDNYPEFLAKQVFINVPWWYLAYNRMISPFLTQRTKSKFVFAGPSKSAETLFKYIAPEQVPVQYGGLKREDEQEFTTEDPVTEYTIKPSSKETIEFPYTETGLLVWEVRVSGWDVSYGAEFVPDEEGGYTVIVQKSRKIAPTDETVISNSFKVGGPGKVVLTFDNQTSKKKKLLYRSKTKPSSD